jgi:hypothetical protein
MIIVVTNLGLETYSGYAALVGGWGNEVLIEKPPKTLILGPIFKAVGKFDTIYYLGTSTHLCDSGIMRPGLLRLAYLGLPSTNARRQPLLRTDRRGWVLSLPIFQFLIPYFS